MYNLFSDPDDTPAAYGRRKLRIFALYIDYSIPQIRACDTTATEKRGKWANKVNTEGMTSSGGYAYVSLPRQVLL